MNTYLIDGIDLNRWVVTRGSTYRSPVSAERFSAPIPGRHGVVAAGLPTFTAPMVTLILSPHVETTDLEGLVDDLVALAAKPSVLLAREVGGVRREAVAHLVSLDFDPERFMFDRFATATGVFELPEVFWRDPVSRDVTVPAGVSSVPDAGTGPVTGAVVRFAAAADHPSLEDLVSGTSVAVEKTFGTGRYAYVDLGSLKAWSSTSSSAWTSGTDESSVLSFGAPGPLQLWPALNAGGREFQLDASHASLIRFRRSWL